MAYPRWTKCICEHRSQGCSVGKFTTTYISIRFINFTTLQSALCVHRVFCSVRICRRPIQARFHYASANWLKLAHKINSLDRSTKSTPSPRGAPTPCRHTVSGSISLPSRGSFHLSIAVLVHYRSYIIFSLGWWSSRIQTGFLVPRPTRVYLI